MVLLSSVSAQMLNSDYLKFTGYSHKFEYGFGTVFCFDHYVIGDLLGNAVVNTAIAKTILQDIKDFYGNNRIVYISNRQFSRSVDPVVYKLVDQKKLIGIAIVAEGKQQRSQAASEQALYSGSFGFFSNLESAISWAQSFVKSAATG